MVCCRHCLGTAALFVLVWYAVGPHSGNGQLGGGSSMCGHVTFREGWSQLFLSLGSTTTLLTLSFSILSVPGTIMLCGLYLDLSL
jgi:hypothetical protein